MNNKEDWYELDFSMMSTKEEEIVNHIREYLKVMEDEPDEYILLSRVYHDLKRILGEEV